MGGDSKAQTGKYGKDNKDGKDGKDERGPAQPNTEQHRLTETTNGLQRWNVFFHKQPLPGVVGSH
jgi:hypothetical protein